MASIIVAFSCLVSRLSKSNSKQIQENDLKRLDQLVTYGRNLYLKGEYEEAYRLFYRLEQCQPHINADCIEYQVQCLMKLECFTQALVLLESIVKAATLSKKNKSMVPSPQQQQQRNTPPPPCVLDWYILASDVCFAQSDYAGAVIWLQRGCEHLGLPLSDQVQEAIALRERLALEKLARTSLGQRRLLDGQREENKTHAEKRIDFVKMLPYDVTSTIFQMMPFECVVKCTWVSKRWHEYLVKSLHLWQDLEFVYNDMPVEPGALRLYLSRLDGAPLKRIKIHHECVDGDALLTTMIKYPDLRLQELDLSEVICTPSIFYSLLNYVGPTLKILRWRGLLLKLGNIIDCVAESCMQLKQLEVRSCFVTDKPYEEPTRLMQHYSGSPSGDGKSYDYQYFSNSFLDKLSTSKTLSIESLGLFGIHELTMTQLAQILHRCPKLKDLSLKNCILDIIPVSNILFHSCPQLERLVYSRNRYAQEPNNTHRHNSNNVDWVSVSTSTSSRRSRQSFLFPQHPLTPRTNNKRVANYFGSVVGKRTWREIVLAKAPTTATDSMLQHLFHRADLSRLERLDLTGNSSLSDKVFQETLLIDHPSYSSSSSSLKMSWAHLRTLSLNGCIKITQEYTLLGLLKQCPMVTHIDFSEIPAVTDNVVDQITDGCQGSLRIVRIAECRYITDEPVRRLVDKRKETLVKLDATNASISIETNGYIMCKLKLSL